MTLDVLLRHVSKDEYPAEGMPEYPGAVFVGHVVVKCAQMGSLIGACTSPIGWWRAPAGTSLLAHSLPKAAGAGLAIGSALGVVMALGFSHAKLDADGLDDRAYRLRHNASQVWLSGKRSSEPNMVDLFTYFGAAAGAAVGTVSATTIPISSRLLRGAGTGTALGVFSFAAAKSLLGDAALGLPVKDETPVA